MVKRQNKEVDLKLRSSYLKWLTIATSIGMFIVLIAGAIVTKMDAGRGCGDDWPLCNGKFVPAYTLESILEYNHRAVTAIVGLLVLWSFIAIYRAYSKRSEAFIYVSCTAFFTVLQSILGMMAVKWEQSSAVMALHFGFSLLAFTFTLLTVMVVIRGEKERPQGKISAGFRRLVWLTTIYSYAVVYLGAFVRHTESSGGCAGWPLCNGQVIPELSGAAGIAFIHRLAGLLLLLMIMVMAWWGVKASEAIGEVRKLSMVSLLLVILQIFSGAFVVLTLGKANVYVFASLVHTSIIAALFAVLCYLCIRAWQLR